MINNLDLNGDGYVDYILVNDYVTENVHSIVLRVALNQNEYQDVAVFVVEKFRNGAVSIQLIGDEALYGPNYIIEPNYAETPNPGYRGNVVRQQTNTKTVVRTVTYYEVATWPMIVYISRPVYRPWRSVWYWGYYPSYWSPWTAHYWHYYYGYHYHWHTHYYSYYRPWRTYRCGFYHNYYYTSVRRHSPVVVVNINRGVYANTYSKPETRREGEALYAKRNSSSGRVAEGTGRVETRENSGRQSAATPANNVNARTENARRPETVSGSSRPVNTSRPATEATRGSDAKVNTNRDSRGSAVRTAPAPDTRREATTSPARNESRSAGSQAAPARTETRSSGSQVASPSRRETAPAAPRTETRAASSERSRPAATTAPASSNRSSSRPAAVESSRPARSESRPAATTRSSESRSNRSSGTSVRSSNKDRSSGSATRSTSTPARNSSSRESGSSRSERR
jgi:hypothetical protein